MGVRQLGSVRIAMAEIGSRNPPGGRAPSRLADGMEITAIHAAGSSGINLSHSGVTTITTVILQIAPLRKHLIGAVRPPGIEVDAPS